MPPEPRAGSPLASLNSWAASASCSALRALSACARARRLAITPSIWALRASSKVAGAAGGSPPRWTPAKARFTSLRPAAAAAAVDRRRRLAARARPAAAAGPGYRLVERIATQPVARGDLHDLERHADPGRRRGLAAGRKSCSSPSRGLRRCRTIVPLALVRSSAHTRRPSPVGWPSRVKGCSQRR